MPESNRRQKILLLGDSLTQFCFEGWGCDLANRYQRRADIINRGMSGYNTRWYLRLRDVWNEPGRVVLVTIFFGANDAATLGQHVPLPEYKANLETMIDRARESYPGAKVLLVTPPPVDETQRNAYLKQLFGDRAGEQAERTNETTGKYAAACLEAAETKQLPCLDLFTTMATAAEHKSVGFFTDGLHFGASGHKFVSDALTGAIHAHFPAIEVRPCSITGQLNNSASSCDGIENFGPYYDTILQSKKSWNEFFE